MITFPQKSILNQTQRFIMDNNLVRKNDRVIVAVSGGPDSICLLDVLLKLKEKLKIQVLACHYNHRLRGKDSTKDEEFVVNFCKKTGVELLLDRAAEDKSFKSEDEARQARYHFFQGLISEGRGEKIALAHHANDLAETYIMRVLRGAGPKGLSAIPSQRESFIRPFLEITRSKIEAYLRDNELKFRIDKSNQKNDFLRNKIRNKLIPELREYNPNLISLLVDQTKIAAMDASFLETESKRVFEELLESDGSGSIILNGGKWLKIHPSMQFMVLREAINRLSSLKNITYKQLEEVVKMIKKGDGKKRKILPSVLIIEFVDGKIIVYK